MKIKQTILFMCILSFVGGLFIAPTASAKMCAGVETALIECEETAACPDGSYLDNNMCVDAQGNTSVADSSIGLKKSGIWVLLMMAINILTAGVGVTAVGGILYASVIYVTAGGSADKTKKAITMITDIAVGLVLYALIYALMNYIIPGGFFSS